jgi:hypothetical protein
MTVIEQWNTTTLKAITESKSNDVRRLVDKARIRILKRFSYKELQLKLQNCQNLYALGQCNLIDQVAYSELADLSEFELRKEWGLINGTL